MDLPDKTSTPASSPIDLPELPEMPAALRSTPGAAAWDAALRSWWKRVRETLQRELN